MWVALFTVALIPMLLLAPVIAPIALVVLVTAIIGWSRGSRTWLRLRSKRAAITVTAAAAAVLLVTGSATALIGGGDSPTEASASSSTSDRQARVAAPEPTPSSTPSATPTPTPTPTPTAREEVVVEAIAFASTTVDDSQLPSGERHVTTEGRAGERTLTYLITELDGAEISRELVSDVVTVEPVAEVVAVGTYVAPPPEPEPAPAPPAAPEPAPAPEAAQPSNGCDPNYADACVPIASDVDCAGGSGNGPAYFDGVARVVGTDIYDLDRDGDGFACEP
ncbi:G5 domain-containing protein [Microbacterium oryzae]|uniref:G5 domain-containing protein n=1 Tax=Microbacterium oryzae TaxID=743009 RepID=UPI0025B1FE22|nr:G5 domain-containing protein [Microbacterium oryzae]MDN3311013.1 G5 domain-containing protein [Microbacterium oryzae]